MQRVLRELERRGVRLGGLSALELFAHSGFLHSKDYLPRVARLEAWELDPGQEAALRRNLPGAEVKITDSYEEIKKTPRVYGLILLDAPDCVYGDRDQYCEHFLMLPEVFRVAEDSTVLVMNVMPGTRSGTANGRLFTEAHLEHRRRFYRTDHPEKLALADMLPVYREQVDAHGFELEWHFSLPRTRDERLHYLVLKVKRRPA
jgi:hypothetical protein